MTPDTQTSKIRSFIFLILIYLAFFASGASALAAEVTWNRMLILVVGNSMSATAMILAVFMGGLGLGSYVGGKVFSKRRPSLVPYVLLEIAIGAYILFSPLLFDLLTHVFSVLAESVANRTSLTLVRLMVTLAALFVPAFLMGTTFPAMISGASPDSPFKRTGRTGFLYSINTVGAAVGCFLAGYYLVLELGVQATLMYAFGLNVIAAVCAFLANTVGQSMSREVITTPSHPVSSPVVEPGLRRFLFKATFGIGFVAIAYEVILTRVGIIYFGNLHSIFAIVLTAFLLGTGISAVLGTWVYGVLYRYTKYSKKLFGFIALTAGAVLMSTPYILLTRGVTADKIAPSGINVTLDSVYDLLGVIIAPTILIGALLPIAIRMIQLERRGEATKNAATLYALNTAGGVLGAAVANYILVPVMGLQGVLILLASICASIGIVNLLVPGKSLQRWLLAAFSIASLTLALVFITPNFKALYVEIIAKNINATSAKALLVHEGRAANVVVLDVISSREKAYRDMLLNGVEEASTRFWHTQLFKLLGILPIMVHESDEPKDALVIAFGAGITAGSVLASDDNVSLDVVDLNPDIEGINDLFTDVNGDVFHNPRFRFHNDDGRNYLVTTNKQYDVIISDSTHPRSYDSWILYTQEFYRSVKKRLRPGGVFAQWVPVAHKMRGKLFLIHLNTFRSVFPNSTFWYVYGSDQAFLLATPEPFTFDAERLQQKLDRLPEWFQARYYQIDTVERLAGFFWQDEAQMSRMIGYETRINTDDLNYFWNKSAVVQLPTFHRLHRFQASIQPYLKNVDDTLRPTIKRAQKIAHLTAQYRFSYAPRSLLQAYCTMPENRNVQYWLSFERSSEKLDYEYFCGKSSSE